MGLNPPPRSFSRAAVVAVSAFPRPPAAAVVSAFPRPPAAALVVCSPLPAPRATAQNAASTASVSRSPTAAAVSHPPSAAAVSHPAAAVSHPPPPTPMPPPDGRRAGSHHLELSQLTHVELLLVQHRFLLLQPRRQPAVGQGMRP